MTLKLLKAKATHQSLQCFGHRLHSAIRPAVKWSGFHCTRLAVSGDAYLIVFIQTPLVQCISQASCNQFCLCGPLENVLFPTIYERSTHMCRDFGGMTNDSSFFYRFNAARIKLPVSRRSAIIRGCSRVCQTFQLCTVWVFIVQHYTNACTNVHKVVQFSS